MGFLNWLFGNKAEATDDAKDEWSDEWPTTEREFADKFARLCERHGLDYNRDESIIDPRDPHAHKRGGSE